MADQQTGASSSAATSSQLDVQTVIKMFAGLQLKVCDEASTIEDKVKAQRNRYLSAARKGGLVALQADLWFKNVEAVLNRRPELLRVVYEHFVGMADTAISVGVASGSITTLTEEVKDNLLNIGRTACRVDDQVAERFLEQYMKDRNLRDDEPAIVPSLVEDFNATSGPGKILLNWSLPAERCDEVEIARELATPRPGKKASAKPKVIYKGQEKTFVDGDVSPGSRYIYRAHSVFQKLKGTDSVAHAVCIGEVREATAIWKDSCVRLSWELPGLDVSVLIFKRASGAASVQFGPHGPEPSGKATEQVYRGGGTSWADSDVSEGGTYHYRIIAEFDSNLYGKGVDVQLSVPKPPPPVPALSASYKHSADRAVVILEWQAVTQDVPAEFVVVRREGSAPPAQVEEGTIIQTTKQTRCLDEQIVAGRRYTYGVFTRVGELYSRTGTAAPYVDVLAEVTALAAKTDDGTVELSWTTPDNVSDVIVRRSSNPPPDHTDGTLVTLTGAGSAKDTGLSNSQRYHYLVCCVYRPDGATEVCSPGVRTVAIPDRLPEQVKNFAARAESHEIVCTWTPPDHGIVVVLRSAESLGLQPGTRLSADEINRLGQRIVTTERGRAVDTQPDVKEPHYSIFTIAGAHAIGGESKAVVVCPDVTDLELAATRDGIILRWVWPQGCNAVRVIRGADAWPEGLDDPLATSIPIMRAEYMSAGAKYVDRIQETHARLHYVIYAQAAGAPGLFFSPGTGLGCRDVVQWEPWMTLRYSLSPPADDAGKGKKIVLTWNVEKPLLQFKGFVLAASQTITSSADESVELFRWTPEEGQAVEGKHEALISLEPIQQRRWARFFCKAAVIDPAQRHTALIIHPDTCVPISDTGRIEKSRTDGGVYVAGVPKEVICPRCFRNFPVAEMLFTSFGGDGETLPGHYTLMDRLMGRPPQSPTDKQGRRLTRKLCPQCKNDLPFTAGAQEGKVIGLIGAKFSGKSHYIAALIKQLQEQVCSDLRAALRPISDETQDRYERDFHMPLFGNGLELPFTVGTPPPLIYDLTLSGHLWGETRNRSVTLALYDTAGENFDRAETVRQMVDYLRVASGIIFLIDPLQVQSVREALPSMVPLPDLDRMADPSVIISRVLQELEDGKVMTGSSVLTTPVAVVLTKCDVLRDAGLIAANRLWSTDKRHIGYFDTEAHDDMVGMMGEYMQRWSQAAYNIVTQHFAQHAFFGVSATGCAPDKNTRRYKYVSPWRVEDPLLWLLAEMGIIPTR